MLQQYYIFDLDGTVLDSSHRSRDLEDGSLDLDYWRENSTPEKIADDEDLPFMEKMLETMKLPGVNVLICTSRVMREADYIELAKRNIFVGEILSRQGEQDTRSDADLKEWLLRRYANANQIPFGQFAKKSIMFDDRADVRHRLRGLGFRVVDPMPFNLYQLDKSGAYYGGA